MRSTTETFTTAEATAELHRRGIMVSGDQMTRCTYALWPAGEVRSGRGKPSRYRPHHVDVLAAAAELLDITPALSYEFVGLLRRHVISRGEDDLEFFRSLLALTRAQRGYDLNARTA